LTDALMCGEGWEGPVRALLRESMHLVNPNLGGRMYYILVSYKIGRAIQTAIQEMCDEIALELELSSSSSNINNNNNNCTKEDTDDWRQQQQQPLSPSLEWKWQFDIDEIDGKAKLSNDRVSVSIGTVTRIR